jgi:dihydroorotase-like cyclic amidohydrolase
MKIFVHGTIVEDDGVSQGRIVINNGRFESLSRNGPYTRWKSETGNLLSYGEYRGGRGLPEFLIFPGFIDVNCSTFEHLASLSGGITSTFQYGTHIQSPFGEIDYSELENVVFKPNDIEEVRSAITKTKIHGLRSRVVISTIESLRLVQQARADGFEIFSEVHPLHLYFDSSSITPENQKSLFVDPPLQLPENREELLEAFKAGEIDILSSGHTPHSLSESMAGVPELDTFGSLVAWLIEEGTPPEVIFKVACANPADWVKDCPFVVGRIKEGYDANLTVLAFNKPAIDGRQLYTFCGWSPYDLRNFRGSVETVILNGEKVVNGQWVKH